MAAKEGKKNRKYGRGLRSPSHKRYNAENRRDKHKANRVAHHMREHPNWSLSGQRMSSAMKARVRQRLREIS